MRLLTKKADDLVVVYSPDEHVKLGDTLFVDGIVSQVINIQFADVPGVLEHVLRKSLITESNTEENMHPQVKSVIDSLADQKVAIAKIRGRLADETNSRGVTREVFKSGLTEFNVSRAKADIKVLDQTDLFSALGLEVQETGDFCKTLSSQPKPFEIMPEKLGINLITGMKGSGKSYAAKRLLLKLIDKGVLTLVFDLNGEYLNLWKSDEENRSNKYGSAGAIKVYVPHLRNATMNKLPLKIPLHEISSDDFATFLNVAPETQMYPALLGFWKESRGSKFDLNDLKSYITGLSNAFVRAGLEDRIKTAEISQLFGPNDLVDTIKKMQEHGGALIFDLSRAGVWEKRIIVEFVLRTMSRLGQSEEIKPISLFLEEAQLYLDSQRIKNVLTRMRHLGIFPTFITNDPRALPNEVYSLLDNLIAFMFRNEDDLRQLAKCGFVDYDSISALKHLENRQCIAIGNITSLYPLFVEINPQIGVEMGGETKKLIH
jgi:hypothetical protein